MRGGRGDDYLDGGTGNDSLIGGIHVIGDTCVVDAADNLPQTLCEIDVYDEEPILTRLTNLTYSDIGINEVTASSSRIAFTSQEYGLDTQVLIPNGEVDRPSIVIDTNLQGNDLARNLTSFDGKLVWRGQNSLEQDAIFGHSVLSIPREYCLGVALGCTDELVDFINVGSALLARTAYVPATISRKLYALTDVDGEFFTVKNIDGSDLLIRNAEYTEFGGSIYVASAPLTATGQMALYRFDTTMMNPTKMPYVGFLDRSNASIIAVFNFKGELHFQVAYSSNNGSTPRAELWKWQYGGVPELLHEMPYSPGQLAVTDNRIYTIKYGGRYLYSTDGTVEGQINYPLLFEGRGLNIKDVIASNDGVFINEGVAYTGPTSILRIQDAYPQNIISFVSDIPMEVTRPRFFRGDLYYLADQIYKVRVEDNASYAPEALDYPDYTFQRGMSIFDGDDSVMLFKARSTQHGTELFGLQ